MTKRMRQKRCFNCRDQISPLWRMPLCRDCRRAIEVTIAIMGLGAWALDRLAHHMGWW